MSQTFTVVNDDVLVDAIRKTRTKIVYVAPGISNAVAQALEERFPDLGSRKITIIVDIDAEVYRLGYGDIEGLDRIKQLCDKHSLKFMMQPGVRIGVLITDDKTLVYTPTPLLIEAGSKTPEKPNAIAIQAAANVIENACACDPDTLPNDAEIGKEVVCSKEFEAVKKDLEDAPPKPFNIARIERTFNSKIQYVELKVINYRLTKKIVSIPTDLLGLQNDREIQDRWRNTFRMFDGSSKIQVNIPYRDKNGMVKRDKKGEKETIPYDESAIERDRKNLKGNFLFEVPEYDIVIFRSRRNAFDQEVEAFQKRLEDYQKALVKEIEKSIEETIRNLVSTLFPLVKKNPPLHYLKADDITDDHRQLEQALEEDLRKHIKRMKKIATPEIKLKFKDISYETIHDPNFRMALEKSKIPQDALSELFSEHYVAPEKGSSS